MTTLKYKDDTDRAYGLTGMSIGLCLLDHEQYIDCVNLDAEADHGIEFTPDFFLTPNQKLSAKAVWHGNLSHFRLLTGMVVANLLCRSLVKEHADLTRDLTELVIRNLQLEGAESCSLDEDETRALFNESFDYFHRVFRYPQVGALVEQFVDNLNKKRSLPGDEVLMLLRPLMR